MKTKKLSAKLGLGAVLAGSLFLISPMFAVIDVWPDFIGYALILWGVGKFADMNAKIADAATYFRRMVLLGVARMVAVLVVYGMASPTERPTMQLLCSFVLCVLDCMTLIPAWKNLSGGLLYLATRHGGEALFDVSYKKKNIKRDKTLLDKITKSTVVFLVAREVLSTLPEFSVLTSPQGGADVTTRTSLYEYIGFMRQMCSIIVVIWGIVWLVKFLRFGFHLGHDKLFFEQMREKYQNEVLTRPELFARRGVKSAMVFMCIGMAFSVDFFLADIYTIPLCVTPDFLLGLLVMVGLLIIRKYVKSSRFISTMIVTVVYTALAAMEWAMQLIYIDMRDMRWAYHDEVFFERWQHMIVVKVLTSLAFIVLMVFLVKLLGDAVNRYTGFSVTAHDSQNPNERIKELHRELKKRLWVAFGVGVASAISSVMYIITLPLSSNTLWELVGVVDIAIPMILAVVFVHATMQIFEQIDYKYMLS